MKLAVKEHTKVCTASGRYLGMPRTPFSAILSKLRREALQFDRSGILKQSPKL